MGMHHSGQHMLKAHVGSCANLLSRGFRRAGQHEGSQSDTAMSWLRILQPCLPKWLILLPTCSSSSVPHQEACLGVHRCCHAWREPALMCC